MHHEDYLNHYGVLGMRWGFRKDRRTGRLRRTGDVLRDAGKRAVKATKSSASKAGIAIKDEAGRYYLNPKSVEKGERLARDMVNGVWGGMAVSGLSAAAYGVAGETARDWVLSTGLTIVGTKTLVNVVNDAGGLIDAGSPIKRRK